MATEWQGKSRGTVLGYKIYVFIMKHLGMGAAYLVLYFVAAYFCFFSKDSTRAIYYYFKNRLNYSSFKSYRSIFKSYYVFGQTILDKIAISSNLSDKFTYEFDGAETITETLKEKKGGILISAHVGNFEISEYFFNQLEDNASISLLTTDVEHTAIKNYLDSVREKSSINLIIIKDDLSHIFEVNAALARNEIVCITGDRYTEGTKHLTETLLGESAKFPAGPFMLASRLNVPVLFVYVMKETNKHYHLYARRSQAKHRDAQGLLKEFTESVSWMLQKYPLQWFNYFDFWDSKNA
ncbi:MULTISPECIES: LpxL/LpxP family acyltransferase [Bizionia]|uniref:Lipid A biosynthesis acyltransferase n=1 Tax=Bizionia algoritergicola TaxID=291187 RepID=A0A5D0R2S1_9FLAO|nr:MULTISPECIES: lipid A biosynthesis acyltransferase [Bizionia]OBX24383.1 lipid A biosynthesis acyltransferase [Bizionia sp. APA-3]TYB75305.1 lipid A biosynthesis acyltransferase [Bizionia algoritergicola]